MTTLPAHRPRGRYGRPAWTGALAPDAKRSPIRQSLCRYYTSRTDPTRTHAARQAAKARRQARQLKTQGAPA